MATDRGSAPGFRIWPPIAVGVPWLVGWGLEWLTGASVDFGRWATIIGWLLIAAFAVWNGWCLLLFARHRTGLLPGQSSKALLESGPYQLSRNPLYVGLLVLYAGLGLVLDSWGALILLPLAWAGLLWGAILPEEAYLRVELGKPYEDYRSRVRRWL